MSYPAARPVRGGGGQMRDLSSDLHLTSGATTHVCGRSGTAKPWFVHQGSSRPASPSTFCQRPEPKATLGHTSVLSGRQGTGIGEMEGYGKREAEGWKARRHFASSGAWILPLQEGQRLMGLRCFSLSSRPSLSCPLGSSLVSHWTVGRRCGGYLVLLCFPRRSYCSVACGKIIKAVYLLFSPLRLEGPSTGPFSSGPP